MKVESLLGLEALSLGTEKVNGKGSSFKELFEDFLSEVNSQQLNAREVELQLSQGKIKNLQEALFVIEKADLSLRFLVELRNRALESYQEIMRMQV
ncbi:flagellar hook-basal body complex protein FliE [Thermovibrio sp.]